MRRKSLFKILAKASRAGHVAVRPGTNKLRQLRDFIEERGGKIHKKEAEKAGFDLKSLGLNTKISGQGILDLGTVKAEIDSAPQHVYKYSHGDFGPEHEDDMKSRMRQFGVEDMFKEQRHSHEPSKVFHINLSDDHINKLKEAGVYDVFRNLHQASADSHHPIGHNGAGWVRYTEGSDGIHIDEIQTDYNQNHEKRAEAQAPMLVAGGVISEEQAESIKHRAKQMYPHEKVKKVNEIIWGGRKPHEIMHEAFHQYLRDSGKAGTKVHIWHADPKADILGENPEEPISPAVSDTYLKGPKKLGYKPAKYGELQTQSNETFKDDDTFADTIRKSRIDELKSTTAGFPHPTQNASGQLPSGDRTPNKPNKHIRADTQSEVNLKYELGKADDDLEKGIARRLFPKPMKNVSEDDVEAAASWQSDEEPSAKQSISRAEGNLRHRILLRLMNNTQSRINPDTGKREFLLHRGMSENELLKHRNGTIEPQRLSWTPEKSVSAGFTTQVAHARNAAEFIKNFPDIAKRKREYAALIGRAVHVGAWIPEDAIHTAPSYLADETRRGPSDRFKEEQEILVDHSKIPKISSENIHHAKLYRNPKESASHEKKLKTQTETLQSKISTRKPLSVAQQQKYRRLGKSGERKPGKKVGTATYLHRNYEHLHPGKELHEAKKHIGDFDYTIVKHDKGTGNFTFLHSPNWDTADEPTVGERITVRPDGRTAHAKPGKREQVYHHKWQFVGDDYKGFDVDNAKARSAQWGPFVAKHKIPKHMIGWRDFWDQHVTSKLGKAYSLGGAGATGVASLSKAFEMMGGTIDTAQDDHVGKSMSKYSIQLSKSLENLTSEGVRTEGRVFVALDGDNIGASVERAAMADDLDTIISQSQKIAKGAKIIKDWAESHDGDVYIYGGDDVAFTLPKERAAELEDLKSKYNQTTGFTVTIGVGDTISHAGHAMLYGKLNGKNQVNEWSPKVDTFLESTSRKLSQEEKIAGHGLLSKSFNFYNYTPLRKSLEDDVESMYEVDVDKKVNSRESLTPKEAEYWLRTNSHRIRNKNFVESAAHALKHGDIVSQILYSKFVPEERHEELGIGKHSPSWNKNEFVRAVQSMTKNPRIDKADWVMARAKEFDLDKGDFEAILDSYNAETDHGVGLGYLTKHPNMDEDTLIKGMKNEAFDNYNVTSSHAFGEKAADYLIDSEDVSEYDIASIPARAIRPRHLESVFAKAKQTGDYNAIAKMAGTPGIPGEFADRVANHIIDVHDPKQKSYDPTDSLGWLLGNPDVSSSVLSRIDSTNPTIANQISLVEHPNTPDEIVHKYASPEQRYQVKERATHELKARGLHEDKESVNFSFDTSKLRKMRDYIDEQGGVLHASAVRKAGFDVNDPRIAMAKDERGQITSQALQSQIDSAQKHTYGISHGTYGTPYDEDNYDAGDGDYTVPEDEQRHSIEQSDVFQLNYTPEHVRQMKEAGVYDTFRKVHKENTNKSHPQAGGNGLGWVRYTNAKDGYHIDEIQTDFGQSAKTKGKNQYPEQDLQKIHNIIWNGRVPSEVLHEAFHQHLRDKGKAGSNVHIWQMKPKMEMSFQDLNKDPPVHMRQGYDKIPKKMGYKPGSYGEIQTQENSEHEGTSTWKTQLAKALDRIPGGLAAKLSPKNFDRKKLREGIKVELEHTDDPYIAREIAMDHLTEDTDYYEKLDMIESDDLEKAFHRGGTWYPEDDDKEGMPHPGRPGLVKGTGENGMPTWKHGPELARKNERLFVTSFKNFIDSGKLSETGHKLAQELATQVYNHPDRHAIASGTSLNAHRGHKELRLRHLAAAFAGLDGYGVHEFSGGLKITAPRHSGAQGSSGESTVWHFDGKTLKSFHEKPISSGTGQIRGWRRNEKSLDAGSDRGEELGPSGGDGLPGRPRTRLGKSTFAPTISKGDRRVAEKPTGVKLGQVLSKSIQGIPHVASVAVVSGNGILMGKRNDNGKWTMPGGHLEVGESPQNGALRELKEEAGVEPSKLYYLGSDKVVCEDGKERMIHAFCAFGKFDTDSEKDPDQEVQTWQWIDCQDGLPKDVEGNLHSPKNVTLKLMGLQKNEKK